MPKGILKLGKTNKGSVYVQLDRLNGKPPMPLSYVSFKDLSLDGKECEFDFENGRVIRIKVDGQTVFGGIAQVQSTQGTSGGVTGMGLRNTQKSTSCAHFSHVAACAFKCRLLCITSHHITA